MERSVALKIADVQEKAAKDPRYLVLWEEYRTISPKLQSLLERLPRAEASIVEDYLGIAGEMYLRMLELAFE